MIFKVLIPPGLMFKSLNLRRGRTTGTLLFERDVLRAVCEFNGLDVEQILADPYYIRWIICEWYTQYLKSGGARDTVADYVKAKQQRAVRLKERRAR